MKMCNFMSLIVTKTGNVFYSKNGQGHEKIIKEHNLDDTKAKGFENFCRVEIVPSKNNLSDYKKPISEWEFVIDETEKPDWISKKHEKNCFDLFKRIVFDFLKINVECEIEGQFCIAINSTVKAWENSTVEARENSTVKARGNSTVEARGNSTVEAWENSTVEARENSTVEAWGNSTVEARENSTVEARGNSTVKARGNSTVEAWENSTVEAWENSIIIEENKDWFLGTDLKFTGKITLKENAQSIKRK